MKKYCDKIKNKNGASILIALLFFMICAVAASSILMAASSNAGKAQNNRQEYQKYLAVSSAVQYLCDEISNTSYQGKYSFTHTDDGKKVFAQKKGEYDSGLSQILLSDFDAVFAENMKTKIDSYRAEDSSISEFTNTAVFVGNHSFTIKPQTGTDLDEYTVKIDLKIVKESYAVEFTASLDDYKIKVEMTPSATKPTMPENPPAFAETILTDSKMEWKTGWVTNGE